MATELSGWDGYTDALIRIEAPDGVVWVRPAPIMQTTGAYPDPDGRPIYVMTAHNQGGRLVSDAANFVAEDRLTAELERRGLTWWPAAGGDPSWTHVESGAAVIGIEETAAAALGAEYGQEAIFILTPADRRVVGCADNRVVTTGWSIERDASSPPGGSDSAPAVEITVYQDNLQVGEAPVTPKGWDEYIRWAGRQEGLLCTLQGDEGAIALQGNGEGGVLISGTWSGPQGPFSAPAALQELADADVFDNVTDFVSGAWGPGDVATLVAPFTSDSDFGIDGEEWMSNGEWSDPMHPRDISPIILAEAPWELAEDAQYSISGETGAEMLTRIGPRYVMYFVDGAEHQREELDAPDDEAALAKFKSIIGAA